jgi:yersiniabactin salicyl-AMP ligase
MQWIEQSIEKNKENIAIVDEDIRLTYKILGEKIEEYAAFFWKKGIRKKDNVVLQMPNMKEYVFSLFGLIKIGAIPVITNPALRENEVTGIIEKTNAVAYLHPGEYSGYCYTRLADKLEKKYKNIILACTVENIEKESENEKEFKYKVYDADVNEVAILMPSGGTTGSPKIIPLTHRMIFWHVSCYTEKFGLTSEDVYLTILPLTHKIGLYSPGFLNILFAGGKTVMCKSGGCDEFFLLIDQEKITITSIVPTLAHMWIEFLTWEENYDLSSLRKISIGGSIVSEELISGLLEKIDCDIQIMYGTTEGLSMYGIYNKDSPDIYSGYKYLISGYEDIKIIDENGGSIKGSETGELVVKGPYTIKSYYNSCDNLDNKFTDDGYYRTGDKVSWDEKKGYQVLGRIVEQINRAGEKIVPHEIENCICKYLSVKEAIVVGVEDDLLGEKICVFIISANKNITLEELRAFLQSEGLAYYKMPDQLLFVEKWPLTPVNKIDKVKLKELAKMGNS